MRKAYGSKYPGNKTMLMNISLSVNEQTQEEMIPYIIPKNLRVEKLHSINNIFKVNTETKEKL